VPGSIRHGVFCSSWTEDRLAAHRHYHVTGQTLYRTVQLLRSSVAIRAWLMTRMTHESYCVLRAGNRVVQVI
jgi:hypothetical protein